MQKNLSKSDRNSTVIERMSERKDIECSVERVETPLFTKDNVDHSKI